MCGLPAHGLSELRFAEVITVPASQLSGLLGRPIGTIAALACDRDDECHPIPVQVDARDGGNTWVLDGDTGLVALLPLDDNDELLFMAADARPGQASQAAFAEDHRAVEIALSDPLGSAGRRVYVYAAGAGARQAAQRYVEYDPQRDLLTGARVKLGFGEAVPAYMALAGPDGHGANLLDRLKVRATASLFWGWLRFSRHEDDLSTEGVGWRRGPIRVIRHQAQRVRLGWGIRSPVFHSYTYFYRDFAELSVMLRLRVPATYFFTDISIEVVLDFRDLRGWVLRLPGTRIVADVGGADAAALRSLNERGESAFVLIGRQLSLVHVFGSSPSLASVQKRVVYREGVEPDPPEEVAGSMPSVGYRLTDWGDVGAGDHGLTAVSYALPAEIDPDAFLLARASPLRVSVRPLQR